MQNDDGTMKLVTMKQFEEALKLSQEHARVIKEGDTFMVRGCRFEITNITDVGFTAKGIPPDPAKNVGQNEPCPCGSNKKYKLCCSNRNVVERYSEKQVEFVANFLEGKC
ncbi:MAG: SEC-C metal-binding domain-containing protein [Planctomycetota bacterium]